MTLLQGSITFPQDIQEKVARLPKNTTFDFLMLAGGDGRLRLWCLDKNGSGTPSIS